MSRHPNQELNDLRKAGRIEEAYKRGKELIRQHPDDKYLKGSFGWVLYDKMKKVVAKIASDEAVATNLQDKVRDLYREYTELGLDRGDMLYISMQRLLLTSLRKSGRVDEAYERGRTLMGQYSDDKYLKGVYGWVLYDKVKQIVAKIASDESSATNLQNQIRSLFREYAKLGLGRPDLLFSSMIRLLLRLPNLPFFLPIFLHWAGMQSFRNEDFQTEKGAKGDETYPSLIESLASGVGKQVVSNLEKYDPSIQKFALDLIDTALNKSEVQEPLWLRYRKGQLLCILDQHNQAREHLRYVVRKKQGEFWAWQALAHCEQVSSLSTALRLSSKAYLVAEDKKFAVSVLDDIARLALDTGDPKLAKWAVDKHVSVRQGEEWPQTEFIKTQISADWYSAADVLKNPEQVLAKHAESVESLIIDEDSWCKANLLEEFTSKRGKKHFRMVCKVNNGTSVEIIPAKRYPDFSKLQPGTPVHAAIESSEERNQIMALRIRDNGQPFDCLQKIHGILDHHNKKKELASIYLTSSEVCLLPYAKFEEVRGWEVGCSVILTCIRDRDRYQPYKASCGSFRESEYVFRKTGELRIHEKGFGFVGDVFVPPNLVKDMPNGARVTVVALKKSRGWNAVSLKREDTSSE